MSTSLFVGIYQELQRAWPNRWLGYFVAFVITAVVGLVVTVLPDHYESKAKVYINSAVVLEPLIKGLAVDDDNESRVRLLRVLQQTLVDKENIERLIKTPGIGFDVSSVAARNRAADIIRAGIKVTEEEQNLFALEFVDTNPVRARNVAHGLLSLFIERNVVDARNQLTAAREFLDKQIAEYEVKLRTIEAQIAEFQVSNVDSLGTTSYQARLSAARSALREAQVSRQIAVQTRDKIQAQITSGSKAAPIFADGALPAVVDRLNALQAQLNTLLLQYTDRHPDVIATRREIGLLGEQYGLGDTVASVAAPLTVLPGQVPPESAVNSAVGASQPGELTKSSASGPKPIVQPVSAPASAAAVSGSKMRLLQANFSIAEAERRIAAAQAELAVVEQMMSTAPTAETTLEQLNRDQLVLKENFEQLIRRRESARMRTDADVAAGAEQFRIIVAPSVPDEPAGPDRQTFLLLGTMFAVAAGAGLAYALGLLRGTFVSATEAEEALGLPVIARLTDRHGVLSHVGASADTLVLLGAIAALFVGAYVLSATTELLTPLRTEVYRLIEVTLGQLL